MPNIVAKPHRRVRLRTFFHIIPSAVPPSSLPAYSQTKELHTHTRTKIAPSLHCPVLLTIIAKQLVDQATNLSSSASHIFSTFPFLARGQTEKSSTNTKKKGRDCAAQSLPTIIAE